MAIESSEHTRRCVALIGLRGSGKTVVGRELAKLVGGSHIDTDELVARAAGCSIAEIFATKGEGHFRKLERAAVLQAVGCSASVISVGGGAVLDEENVRVIRAGATVVWLTAPVRVLWQRTAGDPTTADSRPPLTELTGETEVERLLEERTPLYMRAADLTIDTADRSPEEVAREVMSRVFAEDE